MTFLRHLFLLLSFLLLLSSCGSKSDQNSAAPAEEVMPTEVIDERDHSSEIPNDPKFESNP